MSHSTIWHCCKISDMKKIEQIQKRALQYIFDDHISSYPELRSNANEPLLYVHRIRVLILEIYIKSYIVLVQSIWMIFLQLKTQLIAWEILWNLLYQNPKLLNTVNDR